MAFKKRKGQTESEDVVKPNEAKEILKENKQNVMLTNTGIEEYEARLPSEGELAGLIGGVVLKYKDRVPVSIIAEVIYKRIKGEMV